MCHTAFYVMLLNSMFTLIKEMVSPVMTSTITEIASNLNETFTNRYELVLTIAELAKKLLDEARTEQDRFFFRKSDLPGIGHESQRNWLR
jgi:hypothetical protein